MALNLRPISSLENMPVLDLESGAVLGRVLDWVFDANKQKLVAFVLNRGGMLNPPEVLVPTDIVEYGPRMIVARNQSAIIHPKEVVGLPELMKAHANLMGYIAETETGKVLGKIDNLDIDTVGSHIQRYHVRPSLVASITQPDLLIPANKFVRLQKNRIIFTADADKITVETKTESTPVKAV